jgi:hypothetical protein
MTKGKSKMDKDSEGLSRDEQLEKFQADLVELARPTYDFESYGLEDLWSEVLPGLWQGGTDDFDTIYEATPYTPTEETPIGITKKDFDVVVTAYAWAKPVDWGVKEVRFGFYDADMSDINMGAVYRIVNDIHADWKRGDKVLVRCQAGWNRSGLITALILMKEGYTADDAIALIRKKRSPHALCNKKFEKFLRELPPFPKNKK